MADKDLETRGVDTQYDRPLATAMDEQAGCDRLTVDDMDNLRHTLGVDDRTPRCSGTQPG